MSTTIADPYAASRDTLELLYTDLLGLLGQLDDECVRWVPPVPETNAISGMVRHMLGATANWLARAAGAELTGRNRDAELHATDSVADLVATLERALDDVRQRFETLRAVDPLTRRRFRLVTRQADFDETVAWCVQHALVHAAEHWGQIQLTRQWYAAR